MRILILFSALVFYTNAHSSFELKAPDAAQTSLGNTMTLGSQHAASFIVCPALLANTQRFSISFSKMTLYGIHSLINQSISFSFLTPLGGLGFSYHQFGNKKYKEITYTSGWGKKLSQSLHIGLLFNCHELSIQHYGSCRQWSLDIAFIYKILKELHLYHSMQNIIRNPNADRQSLISVSTKTGMIFHISKTIHMAAEYYKESPYPAEIRFGIELHPCNFLYLRSGLTQSPETLSMGFRLKGFGFILDYGLQCHKILGNSHCITITL